MTPRESIELKKDRNERIKATDVMMIEDYTVKGERLTSEMKSSLIEYRDKLRAAFDGIDSNLNASDFRFPDFPDWMEGL